MVGHILLRQSPLFMSWSNCILMKKKLVQKGENVRFCPKMDAGDMSNAFILKVPIKHDIERIFIDCEAGEILLWRARPTLS